MKKLIYLLYACIGMSLFYACENEDDNIRKIPNLTISDNQLNFVGNESKLLRLSAHALSSFSYEIISYPEWISISPVSGSFVKEEAEITLTTYAEYLQPGLHEENLIIESSLGNDTVKLAVSVGEYTSFEIPDFLNVDILANEGQFEIKNKSNIPVEYTLETSNDYIILNATSGNIPLEEHKIIDFTINRKDMDTGTYESEIIIHIQEETQSLKVIIENFKEEKILLDSDVIDAEFCRATNTLVFVSSSPGYSVSFYNISEQTFTQLELSYHPNCVSISEDGNYAVIGHNNFISYVDIRNHSVLETMDVRKDYYSYNVKDIIIFNNWVYASPEHYYGPIVSVDLKNYSKHYISTPVTDHLGLRLHPSGNYFYAIENYTSTPKIHKFDIQEGEAKYLYKTSDNTHLTGRDLWISDDGSKLYTPVKTVFSLSEQQENDITYLNTLELSGSDSGIKSLVEPVKGNNIYLAVLANYDWWNEEILPSIYVYNRDNFSYKENINLENYIVKYLNNTYDFIEALPHFIFTDKETTSLVVISYPQENRDISKWAIQIIPIDDI